MHLEGLIRLSAKSGLTFFIDVASVSMDFIVALKESLGAQV
jgi:hypothetical protein